MEDRPSQPVRIVLTASLSPSEDPSKVLAAAKNVFGECPTHVEQSQYAVKLTSEQIDCLQKLHDQLRDRRVRGAARRLLLRSMEEKKLSLLINRQAAFVGILSLCSAEKESPLGPIFLEIHSDAPEKLVDWLASY